MHSAWEDAALHNLTEKLNVRLFLGGVKPLRFFKRAMLGVGLKLTDKIQRAMR